MSASSISGGGDPQLEGEHGRGLPAVEGSGPARTESPTTSAAPFPTPTAGSVAMAGTRRGIVPVELGPRWPARQRDRSLGAAPERRAAPDHLGGYRSCGPLGLRHRAAHHRPAPRCRAVALGAAHAACERAGLEQDAGQRGVDRAPLARRRGRGGARLDAGRRDSRPGLGPRRRRRHRLGLGRPGPGRGHDAVGDGPRSRRRDQRSARRQCPHRPDAARAHLPGLAHFGMRRPPRHASGLHALGQRRALGARLLQLRAGRWQRLPARRHGRLLQRGGSRRQQVAVRLLGRRGGHQTAGRDDRRQDGVRSQPNSTQLKAPATSSSPAPSPAPWASPPSPPRAS